ncbi:hypothetical protein CBD41_00745 [bacterium TMED181]|nr:hypothetical protein [Planctomycetota bacterium]OUW47512.1 MAG: hypothetical protein CBD41_00745 [bacterium TMED181]
MNRDSDSKSYLRVSGFKWAWLLVALLVSTPDLFAHDGVHVDVDRINKQIESSDDPGPLYLIRAKLCRKHGRPDLGLQDLNWARGCGVDPEAEMLERAMCLRDSGKESAALELLDQLVQRSGNLLTEVLDERSNLRLRLGQIDGAIIDLVRVHALEPDLAKTLRLGDLYERRGAHSHAATVYRQGMKSGLDSSLLVIARIRSETASGGFDIAMKLVDERLLEASLKAPWYQRRAVIHRARGDEAKAIADLKKALKELDGIFKRRPVPIHQVTRARILRLLGRTEEARQQLEEVLRKSPGYASAQRELDLLGPPEKELEPEP